MVSASWLAACAYVLPVLVVWVARASREQSAWQLALDVPFAVALDLFLVLGLCEVLRLGVAVVVARALWIAGGGVWVALRCHAGDRPRWPKVIRAREVFGVWLAAWAAVRLSLKLSRPEVIWDREWHAALASSLRGQSLPFQNVYEAGRPLRYHFSGDMIAAELQTLSRATIGSNLALSLAHDVMFGLIAITVALLMVHRGGRWAPLVFGALGMLLVGPSALRGGVGHAYLGFNFHSFLSLSFRPHVSLAGLLLAGWVGAVAMPGEVEGRARDRTVIPVLLVTTAALGITDETSIGLLGLALGAAWLVDPRIVASTRLRGVAIFAGLAACVILPNLLFHGALGPGGPVTSVRVVPWRNPGFVNLPMRSMHDPGAWSAIAFDVLPLGLCSVGLASMLLAHGSRTFFAVVTFVATFTILGVVVLMHVEVNESVNEVQRFMMAPTYAGPLVALLWLRRAEAGTFARAAILGGLGFSAFSSLAWMREYSPFHDASEASWTRHGVPPYAVNCRDLAGSVTFEAARPAYVEDSIFYLWAGCHPSFLAGRDPHIAWTLRLAPVTGAAALGILESEVLRGDGPLEVVCAAGDRIDPVCTQIPVDADCRYVGAFFRVCSLTAEQRLRIVR